MTHEEEDKITFRLPAKLKREVLAKAKDEDLTVSQIMRRAIRADFKTKAKARR